MQAVHNTTLQIVWSCMLKQNKSIKINVRKIQLNMNFWFNPPSEKLHPITKKQVALYLKCEYMEIFTLAKLFSRFRASCTLLPATYGQCNASSQVCRHVQSWVWVFFHCLVFMLLGSLAEIPTHWTWLPSRAMDPGHSSGFALVTRPVAVCQPLTTHWLIISHCRISLDVCQCLPKELDWTGKEPEWPTSCPIACHWLWHVPS